MILCVVIIVRIMEQQNQTEKQIEQDKYFANLQRVHAEIKNTEK